MPGLAKFIFTNYEYYDMGSWSCVDVVRRHYRMDHLHESGWSMDFASHSCLFHGIILFNFVATVFRVYSINNFQNIFLICMLQIKFMKGQISLKILEQSCGRCFDFSSKIWTNSDKIVVKRISSSLEILFC